MSALDKARRQRELLAVLREQVIHSQEELRRALRQRGFPVTQATLSRDLKELRVPCVPTAQGYRYAVDDTPVGVPAPTEAAPGRLQNVAAQEVTGVEANEVAVVIRTLTGRAQGVAVWLDGLRLPNLLATLAGDDAILVVPRHVQATDKLKSEIAAVLQWE
ncbi:MAG TPA: arginine repressor [Candidatus Krumholzibacteria bacterium]|jgi:transcriptional regulator of arginine metabolism|nr:arginine repressor [Candidatus Krumholzibacteria bacterium]